MFCDHSRPCVYLTYNLLAMPKHLYFLIFIILNFTFINCNNNEQCLVNNKNKCKQSAENKYSKGANNKFSYYLEKIKQAEESYKPCNETNCNCHAGVITNNLKSFKNGITKEMIENIRTKGTKYQIINGHLYRDKDCMFPARCSGIEYFLLKIISKLPNMELIINTRDWPQVHTQYGPFGPVFSFSKTEEYHDIMYPAWSFWEGGPAIGLYPKGIGKWATHRVAISQVANETAWDDKINKAFFRGSRTSFERDPLVLLSREHPELVDAQYTKNQAWKSDADTLHAPPASEVSFTEHCKYRYLFNFRGVAASFRFKHVLLCKSLVFHVGDEWLEFFYPALKPWIHYIPVDANATKEKIKELIEFAMNNQDIVKNIALNGFNFIWDNVKIKDVVCYWKRLLQKYSKLLLYQPKLELNLIEIKQA